MLLLFHAIYEENLIFRQKNNSKRTYKGFVQLAAVL